MLLSFSLCRSCHCVYSRISIFFFFLFHTALCGQIPEKRQMRYGQIVPQFGQNFAVFCVPQLGQIHGAVCCVTP